MSTTQFKSWTPQIRYKANLEMDLRTVTLNQTGQLWGVNNNQIDSGRGFWCLVEAKQGEDTVQDGTNKVLDGIGRMVGQD
jgi:hypothetical protein